MTGDAPRNANPYPLWHSWVFALFLAGTVLTLLFNAWTSDDAFFTFRVVDNFIQGFGFRFNVLDRVQVYTNPLWMLVHIPFYALYDNISHVTIGISFACALASIWLVIRALALPPLTASVLFLLPLALSKTHMEFFSSGLENPMTSLLFAWFFYEILTHRAPRWFWLTLIVALSMVNRMDTVLAYAPVMGYLALLHWRNLPLKPILLGALPIIAWMAFSLFYYGFVFPNTKYAKIGADLPVTNYMYVGMYYVAEFFMADPLAALMLLATSGYTLAYVLPRILKAPGDFGQARVCLMGIGMIVYSLYVVRVGGSYISCLFMSLPAFMGLCLFAYHLPKTGYNLTLPTLVSLGIGFLTIDAVATTKFWNDIRTPIARKYKVSNFKPEYLLNYNKETYSVSFNQFSKIVNRCKDDAPITLSHGKGGRGSFYGDWCRHQMGKYALADALLARLPSALPGIGRISHIPRSLPEGYPHALESGELDQMHPLLQEFYRPLALIIRGDLLDAERLKTILLFNFGYYDHFRADYLQAMNDACAPNCKRVATGWPEPENKKPPRKKREAQQAIEPRKDDNDNDPDAP